MSYRTERHSAQDMPGEGGLQLPCSAHMSVTRHQGCIWPGDIRHSTCMQAIASWVLSPFPMAWHNLPQAHGTSSHSQRHLTNTHGLKIICQWNGATCSGKLSAAGFQSTIHLSWVQLYKPLTIPWVNVAGGLAHGKSPDVPEASGRVSEPAVNLLFYPHWQWRYSKCCLSLHYFTNL